LKKSRTLILLALMALVGLVLANQNWITAETTEGAAVIELLGTEVSTLLSPLLIFALLTFMVGFYFKGQVTAVLLAAVGLLLFFSAFALIQNFDSPIQTIIDSGELEKAIGQTGTVDEITPLLRNLAVSPTYLSAIILLFANGLSSLAASVAAWNWKQTKRNSKAERNASISGNSSEVSKKTEASSFDLWDQQRQ
jgi:hypothetical protein